LDLRADCGDTKSGTYMHSGVQVTMRVKRGRYWRI